jgi:phosphatidylglycerophosphatase A
MSGKRPNRADRGAPSLPVTCAATVFYSGYSPVAPGTAGSLAALLPLAAFPSVGFATLLAMTAAVFFIGVAVSKRFEEAYGEDPQVVVIDEFAGMWITMLFVPITWLTLGAGFILFRIFDIVKPPPARQFESLPRGWGVMLDDAAAGVYAGLALLIITRIADAL